MTAPAVIHLDLSELVAVPLRTGIQRVEREAIRHWPGPARLIPCCISPEGELLRLPEAVLSTLCADDDGSPEAREAERLALRRFVARGTVASPRDVTRLLNLELFYDPVRADLHLRLAALGTRVLWYVYDFLPFLRPDLFPQGTTQHCMHFLRALRGIGRRLAFLSEQTRQDYATRIARTPPLPGEWPVLHPGADGLGLERQAFSPDRRDFVAIGTIEPRKNPLALLQAFELLWARGVDARLIMAGHISPNAKAEQRLIASRGSDPRLVVLDRPSDDALRKVLRGARALIMPSEAEGFGLPPYEGLYAGIPAIASAKLPSAALLTTGAVLLERMEPHAIAAVVTTLQDDEVAANLWATASQVRLPTWAEFGRDLAVWAQAA